MRFDERFLDEIKARLRLSDVIGKTVKLRRQGREYAGLSPFTKEKTPSFYVNDEKGFYHCFSSGKHGDLISFLQETERLSFPEAVERLANEAGVPMPAQDARSVQEEKKRQGLSDWLEAAAAWFEAELRRPVGAEARAYLERRGLPEAEWAKFRLGFAPDGRTALKDYLIAKGARPAELVESGILIAPEDGGAPYDRFRGRIIFPITDPRGRVISFGGRAMDPNARAKYLNGPETSLFSKSRIVYGLPEARRLLASGEEDATLAVVEGYMDAIACHRAGVAAVAPLGTALTEEQMELLWRFHPEPTLCFDGDNAGRRAAARAIDRALPLLQPGKSFRFAVVAGGKDPDEVLREQGAAALKEQLGKTVPFVEALFVRERDLEPLQTPEQKTALKVRLRKAASIIADKDLSSAYREHLLAQFEALWPTTRPVYNLSGAAREMQRYSAEARRRRKNFIPGVTPEGKRAAEKLAASSRPFPAALLVAAIDHPEVMEGEEEKLQVQGLGDDLLNSIAKEIIALRLEVDHLDSQFLRKRLRAKGFDEEVLRNLERDASKAGVSFPAQDFGIERIQILWSQAYDFLVRLAAAERAVMSARSDMERDSDSSALMRHKAERDLLLRQLQSGGWLSSQEARILH